MIYLAFFVDICFLFPAILILYMIFKFMNLYTPIVLAVMYLSNNLKSNIFNLFDTISFLL